MATPEQIAAYDDLHGRARKDALTRPPTLFLDRCGYEYALHHPGQPFKCRGCGDSVVGQMHVTAQVSCAYTDMHSPLGRRQVPLGLVCSDRCADSLFADFISGLPA